MKTAALLPNEAKSPPKIISSEGASSLAKRLHSFISPLAGDFIEKSTPKRAFFLARPKGFEPPIFRIGICCVIQLRHGRIFHCFALICARRDSFSLRLGQSRLSTSTGRRFTTAPTPPSESESGARQLRHGRRAILYYTISAVESRPFLQNKKSPRAGAFVLRRYSPKSKNCQKSSGTASQAETLPSARITTSRTFSSASRWAEVRAHCPFSQRTKHPSRLIA